MDENAAGLAVLLAVVVVYAAAARRLDRVSVTSAIVFTVAGLALGSTGLDVLPATLSLDAETTKLLAESALVVLLFADASTVDARAAAGDAALVGRLLGIGLPLAVGIGALLAAPILPELSVAACVLLAAMLAPTDAALGLSMFRNRAVPARVRRVLNVESGLNDGIATPIVFFTIAVVVDEAAATSNADAASALAEAARDLAVGLGMGVLVGVLGGLALTRARARGWTTPESEEIGILALAALTYAAALATDANGFVAAFAGGLAFGAVTRRSMRDRTGVTDDVGQVLALLVWTLFGSLLVGPVLTDGLDWAPIAYAVLSLTVVRMAATALALAGSGLRWQTVALMGWFGPRGLASGVFLLIVVIELEEAASGVAHTIAVTGTWTILLSVVLHGVTAGPLGRAYGRRATTFPATAPELGGGPEPRTRRRHMAV
ncbi:MAG TPA: cation:proton antiporter [Miltoncostaea sp.]|nr:cation:proton antiporter [Miltoncostaea sp.]